MRAQSIAVATTLVGLVTLSACAGQSNTGGDGESGTEVAEGDSGTVSFRSWSPIEQTTMQMIEATEASTGAEIDATIFNYPEYIVDLQTRAGSGTLADVVGLQPGALTQQYRENLMPLQDCAEQTWGADWQDQFYPIGLDQARMGNPDGDDNFYALPLLTQTVNLWANSEILDEAGLEPPQTWDELTAAVDTLGEGSAVPFLLPAQDSWLRNVVFLQIANNVSPGTVYEAESGEIPWTDPRIVEAIGWWERLFTDGIAQEGAISLDAYPSGANQFEAGEAAMIPLGAWWIQQSDPSRESIPPLAEGMAGFEPFLFPTIPGGATEPQFVGGIDVALGISANASDPDLACAVLTDWIAGDGAQVLINTFNDIPAVTGVSPQEFTSEKQEEIWGLFVDEWLPQVEYSRYFEDPDIDKAVADALAAVATGEATPEEAAQSIQDAQDARR
ncbi:ABC transporter substrate-binding protein [Serinicoccus kebangsaanensis]|uniref:ABC transporter substrate-binding protein n=1 Tax=Serinicoccus kebangsaanensis TaxID=2602069 RepID=UPI00178C2386|nr:extracellular solute-binding protein [Serinicoccus kebangsaanensis]